MKAFIVSVVLHIIIVIALFFTGAFDPVEQNAKQELIKGNPADNRFVEKSKSADRKKEQITKRNKLSFTFYINVLHNTYVDFKV